MGVTVYPPKVGREWILLTTIAPGLYSAVVQVDWYACRWVIIDQSIDMNRFLPSQQVSISATEFSLTLLTGTIVFFFLSQGIGFYPAENAVFMGTALYLIWKRRSSLVLESDLCSTLGGTLIILWVLIRTLFRLHQGFLKDDDILTTTSPFFSTIGIILVASGWSGIRQYIKEISCVLFAVFPLTVLFRFPSVTLIDARIAHFLLWYLGFDAVRDGQKVLLPQGGIDVYAGCSSLSLLLIIIKLLVAFSYLVPLSLPRYGLLLLYGILVSFGLNGVRLCLMAILIAQDKPIAFNYWHGSDGATIFSTLAIVLFGLILYPKDA
ncbi:MAG: cyanoexosortase A [Prochlorotrichaceae cyanobacterium]|jgi:cyanoexosortase A